jgi:hypothetical protein
MIAQGFDSVVQEPVHNITNWIRGEESLVMISPRKHPMAILGLGLLYGVSG